ncbi:MAG: ComF family protein [Gammaproteobacteria bacterium]|nr:ComF family protein [Gammaproteobacteria bacterium]
MLFGSDTPLRIRLENAWTAHLGAHCRFCHGAAATIPSLCDRCAANLPWLLTRCEKCARPLSFDGVCGACRQQPPICNSTHSSLRYTGDVVILIHAVKFGGGLNLCSTLATLMLKARRPIVFDQTQVVSVPLSQRRLRQRGFNQSLEIARQLANQLQLEIFHRLRRTGQAPAQSSLKSARERRRNVRSQFELQGQAPVHALIVDDVYTSGSTVQEIARVLRRHGSERIDVWTCARSVRA